MPDPSEYRCIARHPEDLESGAQVGPGDLVPAAVLNLEGEHDQRLVAEGLLIDAHPEPEQLAGDALQQRAQELEIEGRSEMSANELRRAVAKREKEIAKQ